MDNLKERMDELSRQLDDAMAKALAELPPESDKAFKMNKALLVQRFAKDLVQLADPLNLDGIADRVFKLRSDLLRLKAGRFKSGGIRLSAETESAVICTPNDRADQAKALELLVRASGWRTETKLKNSRKIKRLPK